MPFHVPYRPIYGTVRPYVLSGASPYVPGSASFPLSVTSYSAEILRLTRVVRECTAFCDRSSVHITILGLQSDVGA